MTPGAADDPIRCVRSLDLSGVDVSGHETALPKGKRQFLESIDQNQQKLRQSLRPLAKRLLDGLESTARESLFKAKPILRYAVEGSAPISFKSSSCYSAAPPTVTTFNSHHSEGHHNEGRLSTHRSNDSGKSAAISVESSNHFQLQKSGNQSKPKRHKAAATANLKLCNKLLSHELVRETLSSLFLKGCGLDVLSWSRLKRDGLSRCNNLTRLDLSENRWLGSGKVV